MIESTRQDVLHPSQGNRCQLPITSSDVGMVHAPGQLWYPAVPQRKVLAVEDTRLCIEC